MTKDPKLAWLKAHARDDADIRSMVNVVCEAHDADGIVELYLQHPKAFDDLYDTVADMVDQLEDRYDKRPTAPPV